MFCNLFINPQGCTEELNLFKHVHSFLIELEFSLEEMGKPKYA